MGRRRYLFCGLLCMLALVLGSCSHRAATETSDPSEKDTPKPHNHAKTDIKQLDADARDFEKVYGWLDSRTIVYSIREHGGHAVYSFNLYNGHSERLFTGEAPIVNVLIHPDSKDIFVHTSPLTYVAKVYLLDAKGNVRYSDSISSYELEYDWSPYDSSKMFITAFNEDWSYKTYLLDADKEGLKEFDSPQPFLKWSGKDRFVYQQWQDEGEGFFAPLHERTLKHGDPGKKILDRVYRFDVFSDHLLMAITVPDSDREKAVYHFLDKTYNEEGSLAVYQLSQYADWLVPSYSYIKKTGDFLFLEPKGSMEVDQYKDGFSLIKYNIGSGGKEKLLELPENQPLSCSPDGENCLYGYRLEKLLRLDSGSLFDLLKQGDKTV